MASDSNENRTVVLDDNDLEKTQFLKRALDVDSDARAVKESLHVSEIVVRTVANGGTVIVREKNGESNKMVIKK